MNAIIMFTLALAAVVTGQANSGWNHNISPPGQNKPIDPTLLMMGDGKMSSVPHLLLMSQPGVRTT